ncbi:MAG: pre-peptidase C-terminal domain-containing protein, partial [Kangiellaceae bacterium]|nr:pre-peptidase C-terminal domain-containing protein [Kangiellaceae bacterium]
PLFKAVKQSQSSASVQLSIPGEVGVTQMQLNTGVLTQNTQQIELNLGKDISLIVDRQSANINPQGSLVWKGNNNSQSSLNDTTHSMKNDAVLVKTALGITGSVRVNGKLFRIRPASNGIHQIIQVDESKMPQDHPPGEMQILEQTADLNAAINNLNFDNIAPQASANAPDIKILVAYTAAAKAQVSDIQGLIELAVAETNTGYSNSGVDATMTLVHTYQVSYNESNFSTDLSYFRNNNDGVMDEVHGKRDQYGADVAMIMTNVTDYCGLASDIGSTSATAFAAVYHGCATGYYSFGHEVGHLQSARHNPEADPTNSPYALGHGYQYGAGGWRTVMAYNCSPSCTRINWWSNPNKTRNGAAMGTSSRHDNARVLNLTAATIAGFKGGGTTPPPTNELTNGEAVTGLSGAQGAELKYTLDVPSSASSLSFVISGGSGDADMYVKFGSEPTTSSYDCRPYKNGNDETCTISNIQAGTYHVMIRGYSSFSGVSLTGTYSEDTGGGPGSINESNLSASQGNWNYFTIDVAAGTANLSLNISGGSGDADLYVRRGSQPTTSSYDCRPYRNGNSETCSFTNPASGTWHIGVRAYRTYSGVTLSGNWQ